MREVESIDKKISNLEDNLEEIKTGVNSCWDSSERKQAYKAIRRNEDEISEAREEKNVFQENVSVARSAFIFHALPNRVPHDVNSIISSYNEEAAIIPKI